MYEFAKLLPINARRYAARQRYDNKTGRGNLDKNGYCPIGVMLVYAGAIGRSVSKAPASYDAITIMRELGIVVDEERHISNDIAHFVNNYSKNDHAWLEDALGVNESVSQST